MKKAAKVWCFVFSMIWLVTVGCVTAYGQVVPIGLLPVQDESDAQIPSELLRKVGQEFKQKLTLSFQDILPRSLSSVPDASSLDVEELATLGRQQGVRYVLRCGILSLLSEHSNQGMKSDVDLFVEVVSSDSGAITSLRAAGNGFDANTASGGAQGWDAYDFKSATFDQSPLGQALNMALDQLAQQVHQAVFPTGEPITEAVSPEAQPQPSVSEETAVTYEADQELQQIIAQAESLVAAGLAGGMDISSLQQALEGLQSSLNNKVCLMEQGQDTSTVDQEIAQRKAELENIIAASAQEAVEQPPEEISQPVSGELASGIARVNELLNEALNCILKIQEISTAVQNFGQDQNMPPADAELVYVPVEEPTSDVSGVVTDSTGNPVEGATVIDPQSGVSTSTDSSGSYVIPLVPSGRFATFKVLKGGRQLSVGKVQLLPGRMAFADWQVGAGVKASGIKILPANVIIASKTGVGAAKSGSIKGVVRDVNGRPVARALVIVKGLGMARTDSQGRYMFVKVPPGNYQVMVRKGGSTIQTQRVSVAAKKVVESRTVFKSKTTMAPSLGTQAVLARSGGAMLKGNVGSTSRQPLPGAKVTAVCADGAVSVFSDVKGKYTFKGLRQGRYHLLANKAGYREASGTVFLKSAQGEVRDFTLEKSSAEIQKVLSVRPYPRAGGTRAVSRTTTKRIPVAAKGALCGVVLDAQSGKQIVSAIVQVYGQQTMRTDRKGRYRFSDLPSGTYRVAAGRKGYQQVSKTATIRPNITSKEDFSLKVKEPHALRTTTTPLLLKPTVKYGRVRGKITDSKTGKPMTQATITLLNRKTYSNASGAYSFDNIPAGSCTIIIKKSNYQDGSRRITVQAGRTISVDFRLAPKTGVRIEKRLVPYPVPLKKQ